MLSATFLLLALLLGVGGRQMSLSLRAGRAALAEDMGSRRCYPELIMALCCWRCAQCDCERNGVGSKK